MSRPILASANSLETEAGETETGETETGETEIGETEIGARMERGLASYDDRGNQYTHADATRRS